MSSAFPAGPIPVADAARVKARGRRVIDAPIRMFHWLFALAFTGAYLTGDSEHWQPLHVVLGYSMAGLLAFRLLYGVWGPPQARLAALWRRVAGAGTWLRDAIANRPRWPQAQNLLVGSAVLLLLAATLPLVVTGIGTLHEWGGGDSLEDAHELFGNTMLMLVMAHLGLVVLLSVLRRRNQALPMLTGRLAGTGPDLVRSNRAWLAILLLLAVLAYGGWEWQQAPQGLLGGGSVAAQADKDDD